MSVVLPPGRVIGALQAAIDPNSGGSLINAPDGSSQFLVGGHPGAVNYLAVQGNLKNGGPALYAEGSDANIDLNYAAKGTFGHYFGNGAGVLAAILDAGAGTPATTYPTLKPGTASTNPEVGSTTSLDINVPSTKEIVFKIGGIIQGKAKNISSNTTATSWPVLASGGNVSGSSRLEFESAVGTGTSVNSFIRTSGAGQITFANYGGNILICDTNSTFSCVNQLNVRGATTGNPVVVRALGGDTNPNLRLQANGTGNNQVERLEIRDTRIDTGLLRLSPVTGFSQTIASTGAGSGGLKLLPAGTLASGTITMPSAPVDGQIVRIISSQTITTLTINGNTGQTVVGSPGSMSATTPLAFQYDSTSTTWLRA